MAPVVYFYGQHPEPSISSVRFFLRFASWHTFNTFLDPPVQERGRAVATKFTLQNFASSLGGMISLGLNIRQSQAGRVSDCKIILLTI